MKTRNPGDSNNKKKEEEEYGLVGNRVLVAVTPADEHTHRLMGGQSPLVSPSLCPSPRSPPPAAPAGGRREPWPRPEDDLNVVQKIWRDWYRGSIVTSSLVDTRFTLVREKDLALFL